MGPLDSKRESAVLAVDRPDSGQRHQAWQLMADEYRRSLSSLGPLGTDCIPTPSCFSAFARGFLLRGWFLEGEGKEWRRDDSQDEQRVRGASVAMPFKAECFHSASHPSLIHSTNMYQVPLGRAGDILGSSDTVVPGHRSL